MHRTKTGYRNNVITHLWLVGSAPEPILVEQLTSDSMKRADAKQIKYLTIAMMNRLWIPSTTSIVGLLDVGTTQNNFQELSKWITEQLSYPLYEATSNHLPQLERRFRDVVSQYPEM